MTYFSILYINDMVIGLKLSTYVLSSPFFGISAISSWFIYDFINKSLNGKKTWFCFFRFKTADRGDAPYRDLHIKLIKRGKALTI